MEGRELTYLDNAATTFPKPRRVIERMNDLMQNGGGNPGRSSHVLAMKASETVFESREELSDFFGAAGPEQVCFSLNATSSLNFCIKGLLHRGDHVLISDMEHNAVLRPVYRLWRDGVIDYSVFPTFVLEDEGRKTKIIHGILSRLRRNTRMIICSGASNLCSMIMPLGEIGELCRREGILFVVDGAQCAGHIPISLEEMKIDALCIPSHKGLLGPQGCGAAILGKGVMPKTLVEGGNGINSLEADTSGELPERYEAGTLPTPAIAGLCEGVRTVRALGIERIAEHERELFRRALIGLSQIEGVRIYCPHHEGSVLLFNKDGIDSEELCLALSERGICTRGGYHCSALGHKTLGTTNGGALRVSFGVYNSSYDVDKLCEALREI